MIKGEPFWLGKPASSTEDHRTRTPGHPDEFHLPHYLIILGIFLKKVLESQEGFPACKAKSAASAFLDIVILDILGRNSLCAEILL